MRLPRYVDFLGAELTEEQSRIAEYISRRIEDGELAAEDIPALMVRYGAMSPDEFYVEMNERMALAEFAVEDLGVQP